MALRGTALIPSSVTRTLLCVDQASGLEFSGRLVNPYLPEPLPFTGAIHMIALMEHFFEEVNYPQEYFAPRSFERSADLPRKKRSAEITRYHSDRVFEDYKGEIATFVFAVRFRRNATWQGLLAWIGIGRSRQFRSILELISLIEDAISRVTTAASPPLWEHGSVTNQSHNFDFVTDV